MPRFVYKAKDKKSITQKGIVEAGSFKQAIDLLHQKGLYIINIKEAQTSPLVFSSATRVSFNELVHLTRQLATMVTAGLTLIESLSILRQQVNKASLLKLINEIEGEVSGGKSFAQTLEKYPKIFPPLYLALVKAGEVSGKLDVILTRLADNLEKSRDFRNKVRGALVYPTIIVTAMMIVGVIVMTVVVPRLTTMYKEFGVELPLPTQILIGVSTFFLNSWYLLVIGAIVLIVGFLKWRQTWFGKHLLATLVLKIPVFGSLVKEATLVEVTRTLSMLVEGGVPILVALSISQEATGNILYKEAFQNASKKVERGFPLSDSFGELAIFPPILMQMISVGEQTGKLGESLAKLSRYFESEAEQAIRTLTTMIEPLIMVVLGLGVGFLVMAVLLPIYTLTSKF